VQKFFGQGEEFFLLPDSTPNLLVLIKKCSYLLFLFLAVNTMSNNENKWSCSVCTYDNYQASSKCSVCLHPRGSEVIKPPPAKSENSLVIHDINSSSSAKPYSDFIICPPSCSSKINDQTKSTVAECDSDELSRNILNNDDDAESNYSNNSSSVLWTCSTCTYVNSKNNSCCSQCLSLKSSSNAASESCQQACFSKSKDDKLEKWICNICTYENWNASKKCVMCLNRKGSVSNVQPINSAEISVSNKLENTSIPSSSHLSIENVEYHSSSNKNVASKQKSSRELSQQTTTSAYDIAARSTDPVIEGYNTRHTKSRSPSSSSNSSHSSGDDNRAHGSANQSRSRQRRKKDQVLLVVLVLNFQCTFISHFLN